MKIKDLPDIEVLDILANIDFKELNTLFLIYNEISDINSLEKVDLKKLKILKFILLFKYINDNNISAINI